MFFSSESLGEGITVFCSETHRFGTDAIELAKFANPKIAKKACDLGTGCGIVALELLRQNKNLTVTAVDIQKEAIELVEKARTQNNLQDRLFPICTDLKQLDKSLFSSYDLVTMNPPYKRAGAGIMSENQGINIARFELKCTFDDCCKAAAKLLKPSGRFCICHRPERLSDIFYDMRNNKIEPKILQTVCQRKGDAPMLVLVMGQRNGNSGITILPELYIEKE